MIAAAALGFVLLFALPLEALIRSRSTKPPRSQVQRFRITIAKAGMLLFALLFVALENGISADDLGIGYRLGSGGWVGLAIAVSVVLGLTTAVAFSKPKSIEKHRASGLMPEGAHQMRLFLVMTVLIGFAWEVLYRGYLLWWLVPTTGTVAAVLIAGLAYGLAHGWKDNRQGGGSILASLLFTTGYALTGNLWWLIVIHVAMPLIGYSALRRAAAANDFEQELKPA